MLEMMPFKPCPDEEGIKTTASPTPSRCRLNSNLALMKKGLRHPDAATLQLKIDSNLALMKKGLRRAFRHGVEDVVHSNLALMKKGLRPLKRRVLYQLSYIQTLP